MLNSRAIALRALAGLVAGLILGILAGADTRLLAVADPLGTLWLNGLKMTIIPLVFALLVSGIAGAAGTARAGGLAGRSFGVFAVMLTLSALLAVFIGPAVLAVSPPPPGLAAAIPAGAAIPDAVPLSRWVETLVPANPIAAMAEGGTLQVVVFGLALGFAVLAIHADKRRRLLHAFDALADALLVIVGWVLFLAPVGVFALAFGLGARTGVAGIVTLVHYIAFVSGLCIVSLLLAWGLAWAWGRVPPLRFIRAVAPALAVGFGTQSSLACLPLMVQASDQLGVPTAASRLTLPLAVTTFRITSPMANLAVVMYCAALLGIEYDWLALLLAAATALLISFTVVSLPSQTTFFAALIPIGAVLGVPPVVYALLIAVEIIPDLFRTVGNVVADVAAAAIVGRSVDQEDPPQPAPAE